MFFDCKTIESVRLVKRQFRKRCYSLAAIEISIAQKSRGSVLALNGLWCPMKE